MVWQRVRGVESAMDPIEALTFSLGEEYLEPLMPRKASIE
ncbi:MAG: hypothetical protein CM15mP86_08260 [Gammaproteobacteria bacterium]|nr:MAG: hypothetical protein CM15mP86_08260 [Gammaproteobacteria bacterium]